MALLTLGCMSGLVACPTNTTPILPVTSVPMVAPTVVSVSPANAATGVRADAKIIVTFSQPMDQAATQAAYQSSDLPASSVGFTWDASSTVLTIKPNAALEYAKGTTTSAPPKSYGLKLNATAKDTTGNALAPFTWVFTTLRRITITLVSDLTRTGWVVSDLRPAQIGLPMYAGDSQRDNLGLRAFTSFNLSDVPSNLPAANLVAATLDVVGQAVYGVPCNLSAACTSVTPLLNVDHVFFGPVLGNDAYNLPLLADLGTFDVTAPVTGRHFKAGALSAVRDDFVNEIERGNRAQFRLRFDQNSNEDGIADQVEFGQNGAASTYPTLILEYLIR